MTILADHEETSECRAGRANQNDAFTLVELLVSIVILGIIIILVCGILNQVASTWSEISAQIDRHQNARSILTMIASDLHPAALPIDRSNLYNLQLLEDPPSLINATSGLGGGYLYPHALFWQAPLATVNLSGGAGKMAEVGYFVRWINTSSSNPRAILCRFFVNPGDSNYLIYSQPTNWLTSSVLDAAAPGVASATASQNYRGWFADNVIGLWMRCLDANGTPIVRTAANVNASSQTMNYSFDSRLGFLTTDPSAVSATYIAKTAYTDATPGSIQQNLVTLPNTIEIAIVVIDSRAASLVTQVPSYTPPYSTTPALPFKPSTLPSPYKTDSPVNFWNDINYFISQLPPPIAHAAHVYSVRVPLLSGG